MYNQGDLNIIFKGFSSCHRPYTIDVCLCLSVICFDLGESLLDGVESCIHVYHESLLSLASLKIERTCVSLSASVAVRHCRTKCSWKWQRRLLNQVQRSIVFAWKVMCRIKAGRTGCTYMYVPGKAT